MTETGMEARFKELEAKHEAFKKKVKIGGFIFLIMFVGLLLMGATGKSGQVFSISKIIVPSDGLKFISTDGKVIGEFDAGEFGGDFIIYSNKGKPVGAMGATGDGGGLAIFNNHGKSIGGMGTTEKGGGGFFIFNNQGKVVWSAP